MALGHSIDCPGMKLGIQNRNAICLECSTRSIQRSSLLCGFIDAEYIVVNIQPNYRGSAPLPTPLNRGENHLTSIQHTLMSILLSKSSSARVSVSISPPPLRELHPHPRRKPDYVARLAYHLGPFATDCCAVRKSNKACGTFRLPRCLSPDTPRDR